MLEGKDIVARAYVNSVPSPSNESEEETYILPPMNHITVHLQPFQDQYLNLIIHGCGRRQPIEKTTTFDLCPQQSPATRQPVQNEIHLLPWEQLDRHVKKANIARAADQGLLGEAV